MDDSLHFPCKPFLLGFFIILLVFFIAYPAAHGSIIEIEPDDYLVGTNLSSVSPLIELTGFDGTTIHATSAVGGAPTGQLTFGAHGYAGELASMQHDSSCGSQLALESAKNGVCYWGFGIYFKQPVEWVSLFALNSRYSSPLPVWWSAHDSSGRTIDWGASSNAHQGAEKLPFEIRLQTQGINFLLLGGATGIPMEFDRLRFKVPEPPVFYLLISGFSFVILRKRNRLNRMRDSSR